MSEYTELTAKIEALEKRVKYLEDTFATLADMNKSSEMGQFIAQRQRVLIASKLVNAAAGTQKLNADAQQQVIDQQEKDQEAGRQTAWMLKLRRLSEHLHRIRLSRMLWQSSLLIETCPAVWRFRGSLDLMWEKN